MKLILTIFIFLLNPCWSFSQKLHTFRVDPDNARGGQTSNIFSRVAFIPLETNKESLFGNITKMEVTKDFFVIYDSNKGEIFLFEKTGKFHSRIRQRKSDEYIGDFSINEKDREVLVLLRGKILVYDFEAAFKREIASISEGAKFHYFNKNSMLFNVNRNLDYKQSEEIGYDAAYMNASGGVEKQFLGYNRKYAKYDYNISYNLMSKQADGTILFSFPYDYTIHRFDSLGLKEQFKMVFPQKYSLPSGFASDSGFVNKRKDFVFGRHPENLNKIIELNPIFQVRDYLIFYAEKIGSSFTYTDNLLYSTKSAVLYSLDRVAGDQVSNFIPVLDSHFSQRLHSSTSDKIYTSIPAQVLMQIKANAPSQVQYGKELTTFFTKGSKNDNPIIIESTLNIGL